MNKRKLLAGMAATIGATIIPKPLAKTPKFLTGIWVCVSGIDIKGVTATFDGHPIEVLQGHDHECDGQ